MSLETIFEALQFELFRLKLHSLGSKILKFPEFNLHMSEIQVQTNTYQFSTETSSPRFDQMYVFDDLMI